MSPNKIKIISYVLLGYGIFGLISIILDLSGFTLADENNLDRWINFNQDTFGQTISILYAVGPLIPGLLLLRKYRKTLRPTKSNV